MSGPFDLYLIDPLMPRMRRDEIARRQRQADPSVKILYFTGFSEAVQRKTDALENEAIVEKPVSLNGLLVQSRRPRRRASAGIVEIKLMGSLS
jgi:DNA-binding response OmpR family regulator